MTTNTRASADSHALPVIMTLVLLVIAGLLAMHTLSGLSHGTMSSSTGDPSSAPVTVTHEVAQAGISTAHMAHAEQHPIEVADAGHCGGGCGSAGIPGGAMVMICVLALLIVAIVVHRPMAMTWLRRARTSIDYLRIPSLDGLPQPRPPSLVVLSISRT